jgi:SpoVK/Ycf46/Vps4 family AAA+-type ATPase
VAPTARPTAAATPAAPVSAHLQALRTELQLLVRARYPLVWLVTHEERRAERILRELASELQREVVFWSSSEGFDHAALAGQGGDAPAALQAIRKASEKRIFVLKDLHAHLEDAKLVRLLRDTVRDLRSSYKSLLLLGPVLKIPPELEKDTTVVDLPLPRVAELTSLLEAMLKVVPARRAKAAPDAALIERAVKATLGLTETEAENVFAKAIVNSGSFGEDDLPLILSEKKQILRKAGLLEYHDPSETMSTVGGLERLKSWLRDRAGAFTEEAKRYGLPAPRGMLLLGVQGCGKSLMAKAVASAWKLPLLRLDVGRVFSSYVGASEANMIAAIRVAESLAPAVLWMDEIEKGLSGVRSSGHVDGGVTARVFATLLTWMQEKTAPVFVVATANQVKELPPELLRKGRFDEIFFIDLPGSPEREAIFRIHLEKRKRETARFDLAALVQATEGWSGAEIEQAVTAALHATFPKGRDIETADVLLAVAETVPLSRTMAEEIAELRRWATTRARPAA